MTQYSFAAMVKAMKIQRDCVAKRGIFCSLYSDRAAHFFLTPKAGDKVQEVNKGDRPIFLHIIKYSACPLFPFQYVKWDWLKNPLSARIIRKSPMAKK